MSKWKTVRRSVAFARALGPVPAPLDEKPIQLHDMLEWDIDHTEDDALSILDEVAADIEKWTAQRRRYRWKQPPDWDHDLLTLCVQQGRPRVAKRILELRLDNENLQRRTLWKVDAGVGEVNADKDDAFSIALLCCYSNRLAKNHYPYAAAMRTASMEERQAAWFPTLELWAWEIARQKALQGADRDAEKGDAAIRAALLRDVAWNGHWWGEAFLGHLKKSCPEIADVEPIKHTGRPTSGSG